MTQKEFRAMNRSNWFHSKKQEESYRIIGKFYNRFKVETYNVNGHHIDNDFWRFENCENYDFEFGKHPEMTEEEYDPQKMLFKDAIDAGLKIGDSAWFKLKVGEITDRHLFLENETGGSIALRIDETTEVFFEPNELEPFTPKHNDICTVLTKQGLATKCKVYEHEGELYAIALKDDKPDGTFNPSQIEKFLPL